jgi:DHA1 family inner membrane transport protein
LNKEKMPLQVWILTLAAFAIGTAEFVIAGILPQVADSLSITEGQAGYLISAYALAIVFGGPLLTIYLARFNKKAVLAGLMVLFILGNLLSAFAPNYFVLMVSRVVAMILSLVLVGLSVENKLLFVATAFVFGITSFANVPAMQLRVMNHGGEGQELAATANISAFNLANAFGGFLGGIVLDGQMGAGRIPYAAIIVPLIGLLLIAKVNLKERKQVELDSSKNN